MQKNSRKHELILTYSCRFPFLNAHRTGVLSCAPRHFCLLWRETLVDLSNVSPNSKRIHTPTLTNSRRVFTKTFWNDVPFGNIGMKDFIQPAFLLDRKKVSLPISSKCFCLQNWMSCLCHGMPFFLVFSKFSFLIFVRSMVDDDVLRNMRRYPTTVSFAMGPTTICGITLVAVMDKFRWKSIAVIFDREPDPKMGLKFRVIDSCVGALDQLRKRFGPL